MSKKGSQKRFAPKLHIKKGDRVYVIAGKDKGEEGEVLEVFPTKNRAVVDGINMVKKHTKATQENPGGINDVPAPIHLSNLMLVDPSTGEPTRVGRKLEDGKLVRYAKKSGAIIR
jgi:large subunit ribosomal protein L24